MSCANENVRVNSDPTAAVRSVASKVVDFRSYARRRDFERRKRDRQLEAPPSRAAGIQVENAADRVDLRYVGMPLDKISRWTRQMPLQALAVAFLLGVITVRRRR